MLRKIIFHGYLKQLAPGDIELTGDTVTEIINGLSKQVKGLRSSLKNGKHVIQVAGFDSIESLLTPIPDDVTELHLVPAMQGGKSGVFKIVLGAVVITAAVLGSGGTLASLASSAWGTSAATLGATLVLGGLLEIVSPTPKADMDDATASQYLGAQGNTTRLGTRIPLCYGTHMVHGHILSFNVSTAQTNPIPSTEHASWVAHEQGSGLF